MGKQMIYYKAPLAFKKVQRQFLSYFTQVNLTKTKVNKPNWNVKKTERQIAGIGVSIVNFFIR